MSDRKEKLSDDSLLKLLACGATVESAARKLGVAERTVYRRSNKPGFKQRLQALRQELVERNANTASALGSEAIKTLYELMSPGQPPMIRLHASKWVLQLGISLREHDDLTKRVTALEEGGIGNQLAPC